MPSPILSILILIPIALLGWAGGALVNYLAEVLPFRRKVTAPFCLKCQKTIPPLRYFLWPRRCPECGEPRPASAWLVEGLVVLLTLWLWLSPPAKPGFIVGWLVMLYFGVIVVIDMRYRLILHPVSIFGAVLGFAVGTWMHGLVSTIIGGVVGYVFMLGVYYLGILFARFIARGRGDAADQEAIGFGDVNLSGVIGLLVGGWAGAVLALFLALVFAAVFGAFYLGVQLLVRKYRLFSAIPYGPFLVSAAAVLIYFRDFIIAVLPKP